MPGSIGQPTIGILPWMGSKSNTTFANRNNSGTLLGMGQLQNAGGVQNASFENDFWLDAGTWKVAMVIYQGTSSGIHNIKFNGVLVGTIDEYAAANTQNVYAEITGITVPAAGLVTVQDIMATKNPSSTSYFGTVQSFALIKTAGAHSVPAGADTPGSVWQFLPWMGSKANTNFNTRAQGGTTLGGGYLDSTGAQNAEISWDVWFDAGTYKYSQIHWKSAAQGIYSVQLDGVEKGTIDAYAAGTTSNEYAELTGIVLPTAGVRTFKLKMATKNASSTAYYGEVNSVAWIRTGA